MKRVPGCGGEAILLILLSSGGEGSDIAGERVCWRRRRRMFRGGMGHADVEMEAVEELTTDSVQIVRCDEGDIPKGSERAASFSCVLLNTVLEECSEAGVVGLAARGARGRGIRLLAEKRSLLSLGSVMCRRGRDGVASIGDRSRIGVHGVS